MKESEIELLSNSKNETELSDILRRFVTNNENQFFLPTLSIENRRIILWTALFQHLQNQEFSSLHPLCLAAIRVLSRDKTSMEELLCEKWITTLIEKGGLYNYTSSETMVTKLTELPEKEVAVEALKCLCNVTFNSPVARAHCGNTSIAQSLVARLQIYKDIPYKYDIMLYDMKLLFILTALRHDIKLKIVKELDGMNHLTNCLNEIVIECMNHTDIRMDSTNQSLEEKQCFLCDQKQAIVCEILKSQFNLIVQYSYEDSVNPTLAALYLKLLPILVILLKAKTSDNDKLMELHNNVANLLTSVHTSFYTHLSPESAEEESPYYYKGRDMQAVHAFLKLLEHQMLVPLGPKSIYENISPVLTVLNKSVRGCRFQRKYLRQIVLPPLRDVSNRPEQGNTLRNQLCRLLTTHVTLVRDLVAEFLFVLCKENVGRMVKYTGFGNAAGHLAQKGLLNVSRNTQYSSSSDSDTEEYLEAADRIDPVVGCTRPPRANPFEGMSEEQKEYEAMRLVNMFDKMVSSRAVLKPARIGLDGRPQPLEHVLQLRDDCSNNQNP